MQTLSTTISLMPLYQLDPLAMHHQPRLKSEANYAHPPNRDDPSNQKIAIILSSNVANRRTNAKQIVSQNGYLF